MFKTVYLFSANVSADELVVAILELVFCTSLLREEGVGVLVQYSCN